MNFYRLWFTLLEIMIVIAIIGIIAAALFPQMSFYFARGRDVARISDIKEISAKFQEYKNLYATYPATENASATASGYCVTEIINWPDALPQFRDKQFSQLGWSIKNKTDPTNRIFWNSFCTVPGSYFYNRLNEYGVVAARMEMQTTGANYSAMNDLLLTSRIDDMIKAQPLDKNGSFSDYIFLIITN